MPQIMDWLAESYQVASKPMNISRAVNCFAELEVQEAKSKAPVAVWGNPGTSPFATVADGNTLIADIMNDVVYVVGEQFLWQVNQDGSVVNLGAQGAQGQISIDNNGIQLVWVDGVTGWAYQPGGLAQPILTPAAAGATSLNIALTGTITNGDTLVIQLEGGDTFTTTATATVGPGPSVTVPIAAGLTEAAGAYLQDTSVTLAQITDPNFFPSATVTFFDGYFCFVNDGTKEMFLSPLYGIAPFNAALFASKEATSDLLLAIANSHEQLFLFGQERIETWYDAGNAPPTFPFQRSDGALIQRGLQAIYSIVLEDNTLFWLGDDGMYYRLSNFQPERVSDHGTEYQWSTYQTRADCFGFSYTLWGHKMIVLTFPTAAKTWELDLSTKRWHERESWVGTNADASIGRWRVNWVLPAFNDGTLLMGDSQSGQIQRLNENVYTEFGDTLPLELVGPPFHSDRLRCFMRRFEVDMETGVGLTAGPATSATQYCAQAVEAIAPTELETAGPLLTVPATFSTFVFSVNVYLPDDAQERGVWFSNQTADGSPGTGGVQIGIFNDHSSAAGFQIVIRLYDATDAQILEANFAFTSWTAYANVMISVDTATQTLQVYLNDGTGDQALVPTAETWSSSNPVANTSGQAWHLLPSLGP